MLRYLHLQKRRKKLPEQKLPEITADDVKKTVDILRQQPDNFRWLIGGAIRWRDVLVGDVEARTAVGEEVIVKLVVEPTLDLTQSANVLGHRRQCLLCGTNILVSKKGDGMASCCEQPMARQVPRPLPSSD